MSAQERLARLRASHEHWCDACIDAWAHEDDDCDIAEAYECPEHQPRSGTFYESFASDAGRMSADGDPEGYGDPRSEAKEENY